MEEMGANRCRKMKGGWAVAEAAAVASEGGQKLSTRYEGAAKANPSGYILLSVRGLVGADKNGGSGGKGYGALREINVRARIYFFYIYIIN